jgi:hypothetical protein
MDNFHWTISPGILKPAKDQSLSEPLLISIDGIQEATDVLVRMLEVDIWSLPGGRVVREGKGSFDVFASFKGQIKDGKFKVSEAKGTRTSKTARKIKIQIDGDSTIHEFPIHDETDEDEGGYLEISLLAEFVVKGVPKSFPDQNRKAPPPVFVRSIPVKRPVIAFITDRDKSKANEYFRAAGEFFHQFSDEVRDNGRPFPLVDIMDVLRGGSGKWGEINIVAHAMHGKLGVRAQANDQPGLTADDIQKLAQSPRHPLLEALPGSVIDKDTLLVLRGCEAGTDQNLLDQTAILFGGAVGAITVLAPKFIQVYEQAKEFFDESFEFFLKDPGGRRKLPTLDECRTEIKKNPENSQKDLSRIRIEKHSRESDVRRFNLAEINRTDLKNPKSDKDFEKWARDNDRNFPDDSENFSWHAVGVAKARNGTVLRFTLIGQRLFVDCRQRLMKKVVDAKGKQTFVPVIPDITNPDHYGRSPKQQIGER